MATAKRPFRSPASYHAERITREAVVPFLKERGLEVTEEVRRGVGQGQSQVVAVRLPEGQHIHARVRLCWRRDGEHPREELYAAFQLRARTLDGDWDKTLQSIAERDAREGVSHTLALQRQGQRMVFAALVPSDQLPGIWQRQREVSVGLIAQGLMGRTKKNHATNGDSPTLWLHDVRTDDSSAVPDVLWQWPGVIDVNSFEVDESSPAAISEDSWDDLPGVDHRSLGSDGAQKRSAWRSYYPRSKDVRVEVIKRSGGACERRSCGAGRPFQGFLDVHHILGAEKGDRVWNCVALCPNCHREAHYAPDADAINTELLAFAAQFEPGHF